MAAPKTSQATVFKVIGISMAAVPILLLVFGSRIFDVSNMWKLRLTLSMAFAVMLLGAIVFIVGRMIEDR